MKLFCFPYAGGSALIYSKWRTKLPDAIEVIPVELAGRGTRSGETYYQSFDELVSDIGQIVNVRLHHDEPYALLGFSMGGLVVYEIYKYLVRQGRHTPRHVFIIAREAPDCDFIRINNLDDEQFVDEIYSYDGMPKAVYENKELLSYFLPIIRADFQIHETYRFSGPKQMIESDMTVFWGAEDRSVIQQGIYGWKDFASGECDIFQFHGGHFFIKDYENEILNMIEGKCLAIIKG